jgi:hypothetical protein
MLNFQKLSFLLSINNINNNLLLILKIIKSILNYKIFLYNNDQ